MHMVGIQTGKRLERFKPGKDQGVDGRFFADAGHEVVVQAKHWEKTGINPLLKHLRDREAPKVTKLSPHRYIFATSVPLSRTDKQAIAALFAPHIQTPSDFFGNEDIQDFLRDHPEVAQQHYKLWLCSADVLTMMLNAPIIGRSQFKMEEVLAFAPKYVATKCHDEAIHRLDELGSIIITGEPGIGKSTLAEQLVVNYAANGYQLCVIHDDLRELEGIWAKDHRQVFYFDDFLGRNYLEAIEGNRDSAILAFMRRVQKDKSKRFILTSLTSILQQGKSLSELFRAQNIDEKEFEVRVTDLTALEKARILYNHIWFGHRCPSFDQR
jgi:adenylate kinase family enzyme